MPQWILFIVGKQFKHLADFFVISCSFSSFCH